MCGILRKNLFLYILKNMNQNKVMKNTLFILFILTFAACSGPVADQVRISGEVENPSREEVEIFYVKEFVTHAREEMKVTLDDGNKFETSFPLDEAVFVYLRIPPRTITLYLEPGADVHLALDASDAEAKPSISGEKALESEFLLGFYHDVEKNYGRMTVLNQTADKDPEEFVEYLEGIYDEKTRYLEEHPGYNQLSPEFISLLCTNMRYEKYQYKMQYQMAASRFREEGRIPALPEGYFDFLEEPGLFNDDYLNSSSYVAFLNSYRQHYIQRKAREGKIEDSMLARYETAREIFSGKTRDVAMAGALVSMLNFGDFEEARQSYEDFMDQVTTDKYRKVVESLYEKAMALAPGQPAPDFTLTDIDGEEVSLSDFRGKVVYLDFWASWCGPCMHEVPYARELKQRMEGQDDLVFLYISVDTDENAWRQAVSNHDIQGVHVNVSGFDHEVPQNYNLRGVPTFYLIGRDGTIADNRPPRPSHDNIDDVLLAALEN